MSGINININLNLDKHNKDPKLLKGHKKKSFQNLPWGLNQERLKTYIVTQLVKKENMMNKIQGRMNKTDVPKPDRREELGISFLNHMPQNKVRKLVEKQKPNSSQEELHLSHQNKFDEDELEQIRLYKKWKQKQIEQQIVQEKQEKMMNHIRKQQNLQNLDQYIKYRNKSSSMHQKKKKKKKNLKKKEQQIISKFNEIQNRFQELTKQESCLDILIDSDQEDSVKSQEFQDKPSQEIASEPQLDAEEQKQITELGNLERVISSMMKAAIRIQKVWRGYKTRQILKYYRNYIDQDELFVSLDKLSENQISQLVDLGYLIKEDDGSIRINQKQSNQEEQQYCESIQKGREQSDQVSSQKIVNQFCDEWPEDVDENNFQFSIKKNENMTNQSIQQWSEMLEYISLMQKKGSQLDLKQALKQIKEKTLQYKKECELGEQRKSLFSDDKNESFQQQQQQEQKIFKTQVDMSEIRQALGSEQLIKQTQQSSELKDDKSLYLQNPFQEFAANKFRELLNREKMNSLIQIREQALEERNKIQVQMIQDALNQQQISPKTFNAKCIKLEKWISKEKEDFNKEKEVIEVGWKGLFETFMRTQRDLLFMSRLKNVTLITSFSSDALSNFKYITSNSQSKIVKTIQQESGTMCLSASILESQEMRKVPRTSPSPSPKQEMESVEWDDEMLYNSESVDIKKLQNSQQVIKVSTLLQKYSDQQIQSYSIMIANSLIGSEINSLYEELLKVNVDLTQFIPQRGIKTNLSQLKLFLQKIKEYLKIDAVQMIERLNQPLGPYPMEILKYLHYYEDEECESLTDTYSHGPILLTDQFMQMEKQQIQTVFDPFQQELERIHNKVIFDAVNEALDYFRPYGMKGMPLPWVAQPIELIVRDMKSVSEVNEAVEKACQKVTEWASSLVGIIVDKADSPFPKALMFDIEYLNQLREERMIRMLNLEILENEERWTNYDEEKTEILVDLSTLIFDDLIEEVANELNKQ